MFDKKIGIITPWFGRFAGGAELLARGMAREFNKRGVHTLVFTTCSQSPFDSWWQDHYEPGVYEVEGIETRRFATGKVREPYDSAINKLTRGKNLSTQEQEDFFVHGINSDDLVQALGQYINDEYELIALPYFHGLTHSVVNRYPNKISLIPCFHDEPQFYWPATERLLGNSKHIFFNSIEEKELTIKNYGRRVGRRVLRGAAVLVEQHRIDAAPAELDGEREAERTAADDQDLGVGGNTAREHGWRHSLRRRFVRWGMHRTRRAIRAPLGDRASPSERSFSIGACCDGSATGPSPSGSG